MCPHHHHLFVIFTTTISLGHHAGLTPFWFIGIAWILYLSWFSLVHYCAHPWQDPNNPASNHNQTTGFLCGRDIPTVGQLVLVHDNLLYGHSSFHGIGQGQQAPVGDEKGHLVKMAMGVYDIYAQFDVKMLEPFAYFLPQHYALPFLYKAYVAANTTNAMGCCCPVVWILHTCDTTKWWADNVMHWHSIMQCMLQLCTSCSTVVGNHVTPWGDYKGKDMHQALMQLIDCQMGIAIHQKQWQQMVWFYQNHTEHIWHYYQLHIINLPGNQFTVECGWSNSRICLGTGLGVQCQHHHLVIIVVIIIAIILLEI